MLCKVRFSAVKFVGANAAGEVRRGSAVTSTGLLAVSDSERQA